MVWRRVVWCGVVWCGVAERSLKGVTNTRALLLLARPFPFGGIPLEVSLFFPLGCVIPSPIPPVPMGRPCPHLHRKPWQPCISLWRAWGLAPRPCFPPPLLTCLPPLGCRMLDWSCVTRRCGLHLCTLSLLPLTVGILYSALQISSLNRSLPCDPLQFALPPCHPLQQYSVSRQSNKVSLLVAPRTLQMFRTTIHDNLPYLPPYLVPHSPISLGPLRHRGPLLAGAVDSPCRGSQHRSYPPHRVPCHPLTLTKQQ